MAGARRGLAGMLCMAAWIGFSAMTLFAPLLVFWLHAKLKLWADTTFATAGGISGVLTALAGFSNKTKAKNGTSDSKQGSALNLAGQTGRSGIYRLRHISGFAGCS